MSNWKSTTMGIVGIVGFVAAGVATALGYHVDQATWQPIVQVVGTILGALGFGSGLVSAKDAE